MEDMKFTVEDAVFFLDMIDSAWSPNWEPKMYKQKPYYALFKDKDSDDYKRFLGVYNAMRNELSERDQFVLDEIYGVDRDCAKLKTVAAMLGITPARVSQIIAKGERNLGEKLSVMLKIRG